MDSLTETPNDKTKSDEVVNDSAIQETNTKNITTSDSANSTLIDELKVDNDEIPGLPDPISSLTS